MMKVYVVVANWNGKEFLANCLNSLQNQSIKTSGVIVVDNGSRDGSAEIVKTKYSQVVLLKNSKNLGFAGGVNVGIRYALDQGAEAIALLNNDAEAEKDWLENLIEKMESDPKCGIVASKVLKKSDGLIDNTGECFSIWGLPYPRSRDISADETEPSEKVFGASGGSTLYRSEIFRSIGLFDEDFFAYYEDADMNFRAQLAGWKVKYASRAIVHHKIGGTSGKMHGFTTYQTLKNLPWLIIKNIPRGLILKVYPRFMLVYGLMFGKALLSRRFFYALKGLIVSLIFVPKKIIQHMTIHKNNKVTSSYIESLLSPDLPPNSSLGKILKK